MGGTLSVSPRRFSLLGNGKLGPVGRVCGLPGTYRFRPSLLTFQFDFAVGECKYLQILICRSRPPQEAARGDGVDTPVKGGKIKM